MPGRSYLRHQMIKNEVHVYIQFNHVMLTVCNQNTITGAIGEAEITLPSVSPKVF